VKIIELTSKISVPISNEEQDLLLQFDEETPVLPKNKMTDRQQLLANQLVNKNILIRQNENGKINYKKRAG